MVSVCVDMTGNCADDVPVMQDMPGTPRDLTPRAGALSRISRPHAASAACVRQHGPGCGCRVSLRAAEGSFPPPRFAFQDVQQVSLTLNGLWPGALAQPNCVALGATSK